MITFVTAENPSEQLKMAAKAAYQAELAKEFWLRG
jgi:hypothetical protein